MRMVNVVRALWVVAALSGCGSTTWVDADDDCEEEGFKAFLAIQQSNPVLAKNIGGAACGLAKRGEFLGQFRCHQGRFEAACSG